MGAPARVGRPSAVTTELAEAGLQLLREGATVGAMCSALGVARSSWYRYVHGQVTIGVRQYRRRPRRANAISAATEKTMVKLDRQNLPRVVIAERLGLHVNTVVKYLLRRGRPRRR